jgi:hypothetical protein
MKIISKKRRSICNVHSEIDDLVDDISDIGRNLLSCDKEKLITIIKKMRILIKEATAAGQAMEFRLFAYRGAITKLGFIRDKDGKLGDELALLKARVFELENLPKEDK